MIVVLSNLYTRIILILTTIIRCVLVVGGAIWLSSVTNSLLSIGIFLVYVLGEGFLQYFEADDKVYIRKVDKNEE